MPKKKPTTRKSPVPSAGFGAFCRARREALGLSLSEFCRLNGFDKGNLSKVERGLLSAPHDDSSLKAFAKALKLPEGSIEGRGKPFSFRADYRRSTQRAYLTAILDSRKVQLKETQISVRLSNK